MLAVRARALLDGRLAPSTDDVVALAQPVLRHRMALNFSARAEGATIAAGDRPALPEHFFDGCVLTGSSPLQHEAGRRWAPACRRCWWRPSGWPPPSAWACMAGARPAWAKASGSSAAISAEDPSTAIDWRQSAKSQHLFVREREWEAAQAVWFWRDGSPGMRFASGTACTQDRARRAAAAGAGLAAGARRRAHRAAGRRPCAGQLARRAAPHRPRAARLRAATTTRCRPTRRSPAMRSSSGSAISSRRWTRSRPRMRRLSRIGGERTSGAHHRSGGRGFSLSPAARASKPRAAHDSEMFGRAESVRGAYRARFTRPWRSGRARSRTPGLELSSRTAPTKRRRPR